MLNKLEDFAREDACQLFFLDSFSFLALCFEQKNGYEVYGKMEDHPQRYDLFFLQKRLVYI